MSKSNFKNKYIINNNLKTKKRNQICFNFFLNKKLKIYNGHKFIIKEFNNQIYNGLTLGGFSLTRKIGKIHKQNKKKKNKKNK